MAHILIWLADGFETILIRPLILASNYFYNKVPVEHPMTIGNLDREIDQKAMIFGCDYVVSNPKSPKYFH